MQRSNTNKSARIAMQLMAVHAAQRMCEVEHEWQKERGGSGAAFEAMSEIEAIAIWYRECAKALSGQ